VAIPRIDLVSSGDLVRRQIYPPFVQRSMRAGVEDRWHPPPRRGEQPPWPSDDNGAGCWCTDPKHATPATLVTTARHGTGLRWLARWVDHGGNERSKAFARKVDAQNRIASITAALTTGTYADPKQGANTFAEMADEWIAAKEACPDPLISAHEPCSRLLRWPFSFHFRHLAGFPNLVRQPGQVQAPF
jgi:hypothetical protein